MYDSSDTIMFQFDSLGTCQIVQSQLERSLQNFYNKCLEYIDELFFLEPQEKNDTKDDIDNNSKMMTKNVNIKSNTKVFGFASHDATDNSSKSSLVTSTGNIRLV